MQPLALAHIPGIKNSKHTFTSDGLDYRLLANKLFINSIGKKRKQLLRITTFEIRQKAGRNQINFTRRSNDPRFEDRK